VSGEDRLPAVVDMRATPDAPVWPERPAVFALGFLPKSLRELCRPEAQT